MDMALIFRWINFGILAIVLYYFLRNPVRDYLGNRRQEIEKTLEEIKHLRAEVEKKFQEWCGRLQTLDREISQLKKEFDQEGALEKQAIVRQAEAYEARIREETRRVGLQELKKARARLRAKTAQEAVATGRILLQTYLNEEDQRRLVKQSIRELERIPYERMHLS